MARHLATYITYVTHCWAEQSSQANTSVYRYTLDIPATGHRFGFTSPEALINTLELALSPSQDQEFTDALSEDEPG